MAKRKPHLKSKASSEATAVATSRGGGKKFKVKKTTTKLLILPPVEEDAAIFATTFQHTAWKNNKPTGHASSPLANGDPDKCHDMGWAVRDAFKDSKDKKKKDYFRNFLANEQHHINVLDIDEPELGAQTFTMPPSVSKVVIQEFKDVENDDYTDIADLDEGRILQITTNGETGLKVRYETVKFKKKPAGLLEKGIVDEDLADSLWENMPDLSKLQPKWNEKEFEAFFEKLKKDAAKIGIDCDDLESQYEGDEDEDEVDGDDSDDEFEEDDDNEEDDSEEDDDEESEDDDEEESEDDDEDFEDDEEEDEPVKKKKTVKKSKTKSGKSEKSGKKSPRTKKRK